MTKLSIACYVALALCAAGARANVITVDTTSDAGTVSGNCELREAIQAAETNAVVDGCIAGSGSITDTIVFAPALAGQTIAYTNVLLFSSGSVVIDGQMQPITLQASGSADALQLNGADVRIKGLDVRATGTGNGVTLVSGSIHIDNSSVQGRLGINAFGNPSSVILNNSTVASTETSAASDIAIRSGGGNNLAVNNSTVVASVGKGVDVSSSSGSSTIYSSIIVGAVPVSGTLTSSTGGTLLGTSTANAGLAATLSNNGGPTRTFALLSGAAIDGGDCANAAFPNFDQRFYLNPSTGQRAVGSACDAGAFEKDAQSFADVSISKSLTTPGPYFTGSSLSYTLLVNNAGPGTATNVQVTDTPTNLTITNVSGGVCVALPCSIPSLAAGANASITVTATINAQGAFDNTATANAAEYDPVSSNNTDSTGNGGSANALADISLVKTLSTSAPYYHGKSLMYSIVVHNAGPDTATSVQVSDTPTNLTITNVSGGGCSALPCMIASLGSGANATITVKATINVAGAFDNSATATAAESDLNPANNTDSAGNGGTASTAADVAINETLVTPGLYFAGETLTYTLVVSNAGPDAATGLLVTDTPTNLTITGVTGAGCTTLPCSLTPSTLAVGNNQTITVKAKIATAAAFGNNAAANGSQFDPVSANNSANVTGSVSAEEIFRDGYE